ncbi:signalosome subunit 3 [Aspergillus aurantiobrunneus]
MTDFLGRLYAAPSRRHGSSNVTDESYDRQLRDLVAYLRQPGLVPSTANLNEYLEAVNPTIHSLSFLYLLRFQIQQNQKRTKRAIPDDLLPGGNLWRHAIMFLRSFDPVQVRYAAHEWRQLVELIASSAQAISKPVLAVRLIRDALERLDTLEVFTSTHLVFVKLALLSSSYAYAVPILDKFLCHFPTSTEHAHSESLLCSEHGSNAVFVKDTPGFSTNLTYRDHLQFCLYSAMIYMALKKWDQASHSLSAVISSPTANSVSKIMVEAYKKWILVNLLGHGKLPSPPSLVAPHVLRVYQSLARPYISLAEAFEKSDSQNLNAEINIGQSIWRADNNSGLVSQLFEAYDKFVIIRLGGTFSALAMSDVLQRASSCSKAPHDIEEFVVSLVMSNALRATLSHSSSNGSTAMLRFSMSTQSPVFREEYIRERLIQRRLALNAVARGISQTDHTLELSQEHLHFIAKTQNWNGNFENPGVVYSKAGGSCDMDEDLMGDDY